MTIRGVKDGGGGVTLSFRTSRGEYFAQAMQVGQEYPDGGRGPMTVRSAATLAQLWRESGSSGRTSCWQRSAWCICLPASPIHPVPEQASPSCVCFRFFGSLLRLAGVDRGLDDRTVALVPRAFAHRSSDLQPGRHLDAAGPSADTGRAVPPATGSQVCRLGLLFHRGAASAGNRATDRSRGAAS